MMLNTCYYIINDYDESIFLENILLNGNIKKNIIMKLKEKKAGKCKENIGYIKDILEINKIKENYIYQESLNGNIIFNVNIKILVIMPPIDKNIILMYEKKFINEITQMLFSNGPIKILIKNEDINLNNFYIESGDLFAKNTNKKIELNEFCIVKIKDLIIKDNKKKMIGIGYLENIITDIDKINDYYFFNDKYIDNN